jgi:hypothetical protein
MKSCTKLQTLDKLKEHPIGVGGDDTSDAFAKYLWLAGQERDALVPQSRRGRIEVRHAKSDPV